jgi:hypothetical protein
LREAGRKIVWRIKNNKGEEEERYSNRKEEKREGKKQKRRETQGRRRRRITARIYSPPQRHLHHSSLTQTVSPSPDHKRGRTEQTRGRDIDSRRQREEENKTVTAASPPRTTPNRHRKPPSAQLPEHFHSR